MNSSNRENEEVILFKKVYDDNEDMILMTELSKLRKQASYMVSPTPT